MNEKKNNFQIWMDEEGQIEMIGDHQEIQQRIHKRLGTLRFVGHIVDMYLNKMVQTAGMKVGSQEVNVRSDFRLTDGSDEPTGPSQPKE